MTASSSAAESARPVSSGRTSRRRRRHRRREVLALLVASVSGVVAMLADGAATGVEALDPALRFAYGFGIALACGRARRWTWPVLAGGALLAGPAGPWAVVAGVSLAGAFGAQFDRRRRQQVGALVGALAAQALLRVPPTIAFGVPSLLAFLAPLPAVVGAYRSLRTGGRRVAVWAGGTVLALVVVAGSIGAITLQVARSEARGAVGRARSGLAAARAGDAEAASEAFEDARRQFERANELTRGWWTTPARVVPVVAQHLHAGRVATSQGAGLAATSADATEAVDVDGLSSADGTIDLARIAALAPDARRLTDAMSEALTALDDLDRGWLTPPATGPIDDLTLELERSLPEARDAAEALALAPGLLGADAPQHYVVLFGNPAEAREMGGFVANAGLLTADAGDLDFQTIATDKGAFNQAMLEAGVETPASVPASVEAAAPDRFVQNWTDTPDIDTAVTLAAALLPAVRPEVEVAGALYVDPYALAALLEITGPVDLEDTDVTLDATNAVDFLLRDQYSLELFDDAGERKELLSEAGEVAFEELTSRRLPDPAQLAELLSPLVRARRLLFTTVDDRTHPLLTRVGLRPALAPEDTDVLLVAHGSRRATKLDAYLTRHISYEAEIAANGQLSATATIELTNGAVPGQLTDYQAGSTDPRGTNDLTLSVYSNHDVVDVLVDTESAPFNRERAYGINLYSVPVTVPPGATTTVELRLRGRADPSAYRFSALPNAGSHDDTVEVTMMAGKRVVGIERTVLDSVVSVEPRSP